MMADDIQIDIVPAEKIKRHSCIGRGGFGEIYTGIHEDWGITVAIKILRSQEQTGAAVRDALLKEARMMHRVKFPFVLRLLGVYQENKMDFVSLGIVMEYMENGSLNSLLERVSHVPWALKFRILHEVALGMNYLHGLDPPLLHLDLKPSNILLDESFHVKLTDFGLSKWKQASVSVVNSNFSIGGTLEYMAPEALSDVNQKPTLALDIYSYGILMWSVLTGKQPYSEAICSSLIKVAIPAGQRPDASYLDVPDISGVLKNLIYQCWHDDPKQRPSFKVCSDRTGEVFEIHKSEIQEAVRRVQDILSKMPAGSSLSSISSVVERMNTLGLQESVSQEAGSKPMRLTSQEEPPRVESGPRAQEVRSRASPQQNTDPGTMPVRPPRHTVPPPPGYFPSPVWGLQQGPSMTFPQGPSMTFPQQGSHIVIAGSTVKNVQIGNGNFMEIGTRNMKKKKKKQKPKETP